LCFNPHETSPAPKKKQAKRPERISLISTKTASASPQTILNSIQILRIETTVECRPNIKHLKIIVNGNRDLKKNFYRIFIEYQPL